MFSFSSKYLKQLIWKVLEEPRGICHLVNTSLSKEMCLLSPVPHSSSSAEGCRGPVTGTDTASPSSTAKPTRRWTSPHALSTSSSFVRERTTEVERCSQTHGFGSFTCFFSTSTSHFIWATIGSLPLSRLNVCLCHRWAERSYGFGGGGAGRGGSADWGVARHPDALPGAITLFSHHLLAPRLLHPAQTVGESASCGSPAEYTLLQEGMKPYAHTNTEILSSDHILPNKTIYQKASALFNHQLLGKMSTTVDFRTLQQLC